MPKVGDKNSNMWGFKYVVDLTGVVRYRKFNIHARFSPGTAERKRTW